MTRLDELIELAGKRSALVQDLVTCVKDLMKLAVAHGAYPNDSTIVQANRILKKEKELE